MPQQVLDTNLANKNIFLIGLYLISIISVLFQIDFKKLKGIEGDLVKGTKDFHIEDLERIFTKLMECVSHYKNVYDRSQLPQDLTEKMKTLKLLPQKKKS